MISPDHGVSGTPFSYWIESTPPTSYPMMPDGLAVDVAIIGGGIAGITTAVMLKEHGLKVAIIEAKNIAGSASGHTTAHISAAAAPTYYRKIMKRYGEMSAKMCASSVLESIDMIDGMVRKYGIDCDFSRSTEFLYGADEQDWDILRDEVELEAKLGLPVSFEETAPLPFMTHGALRYQDQAEFHPRKYLLGLAATIPGDGSHVFEETRVRSISEGGTCVLRTGRGSLTARDVVVATGSPISNLGLLPVRMTVQRSYVLGVRVADDLPEHTMFFSTEEPCHYIRSLPSGVLLIGGEDHPAGEVADTRQHYIGLERFCRINFDVKAVDHSWSAQDLYSFDHLPFIGLLPGSEHQYVATGFKGTGMTYGTLSGMIISDLIVKGTSLYRSLYSPGRVNLRAFGKAFLKRGMRVAERYVIDRLRAPGPLSGLADDEAGLTEVGGRRAAAYRDASGSVHAVSPVCRHMGCYVRWNSAERTWDCPCHGSRYDADGNVIAAPAAKNLTARGGEGQR